MLFTPVSEANYNKDGGPARRVDSLTDGGGQPGDFKFVRRTGTGTGPDGKPYDMIGGMNYVCFGCKTVGHLPFRKPSLWKNSRDDWHWDGNLDKPTLTPSIHHVGCWHGHLKAGVFKSC